MAGDSNWIEDMSVDLYERRWLKTKDYISGRGLEIGAGASPQKLPTGTEALYFDKRTSDELSQHLGKSVGYEILPFDDICKYLPDGADFLIAHHVLEHTPDPIGTLRRWHRIVRSGGTLVVSVPHFALCPDRDRLLPDSDHLLLDHLLNRDGDSFESREHVLSFLCAWVDDSPGLADLSKSDCCRRIVMETKRGDHDFHWHAFDHQLFRRTIFMASLLDDNVPEILEATHPAEDVLDILYVYRLLSFRDGKDREEVIETAGKMLRVIDSLKTAIGQVSALSWCTDNIDRKRH